MKTTINRNWLLAGAALVVLAVLYLPSLDISGGQLFAFLMVLLCPLLHFFGMRHGGHGGHGHGGQERPEPQPVPPTAAVEAAPRLPPPTNGGGPGLEPSGANEPDRPAPRA